MGTHDISIFWIYNEQVAGGRPQNIILTFEVVQNWRDIRTLSIIALNGQTR